MKPIGVRFKPGGKIYAFDCGEFELKIGDHVVVETQQGFGFGVIVNLPVPYESDPQAKPLKKVYRLACENDFEQIMKNSETEKKANEYCINCIKELGLKMNLFNVENSFDGSKLIFYFTADGRIDFRQLIKMLVKELCVKIEMRQVGIRNHAKMCGGMGRCGRPVCCSSFLDNFGPVSIRMAKEQGLSLNPTKISGQCGRLMCCLTFENETYIDLKKGYPKIGKTVAAKDVKGKVVRHNPLQKKIALLIEDGTEIEVSLDEVNDQLEQ